MDLPEDDEQMMNRTEANNLPEPVLLVNNGKETLTEANNLPEPVLLVNNGKETLTEANNLPEPVLLVNNGKETLTEAKNLPEPVPLVNNRKEIVEQHSYEEIAKAPKPTGVPDLEEIKNDTQLESDVSALKISSSEKSHSNSPKTEEVTGTKPNASSHYNNTFEEKEFLGQGSFGTVVTVKHKYDEGLYAVKKIPIRYKVGRNGKTDLDQVQAEARYWAKLDPHECIVRYITCWSENYLPSCSDQDDNVQFRDSNKKTQSDGSSESMPDDIRSNFYIQMELCKEPLRKIIGNLTDKKIFFIFKDILSALDHMHKNNRMHRDVKPDNILISLDGRAKLGDFGSTKEIQQTSDISQEGHMKLEDFSHTPDVGTSFYSAPEMINPNYDEKVDIYSLGITLLEMVCSGDKNDVHRHKKNFLEGCCSQEWEVSSDSMEDVFRQELFKRYEVCQKYLIPRQNVTEL